MLFQSYKNLDRNNRLNNCRVQALCDLLNLNGFSINPHIVHLACCDTFLAFSTITHSHINLPFLSCFHENFEIRFLNEQKLLYSICNDLTSVHSMKTKLKNHNPFLVLCDANSILKNKKNVVNSQVGVCSGITIIGYDSKDNFIFSQFSRNGELSSISPSLLSYARTVKILPSSPMNRAIIIEHIDKNTVECRKKLDDFDYLLNKVCNNLERLIKKDIESDLCFTNQEIPVYYGRDAQKNLMEYIDKLSALFYPPLADIEIANKVFALKLKMLRKSMISGSATLNRLEYANSLDFLYAITSVKSLKQLSNGFRISAKNFRNIMRLLSTVEKRIEDKDQFLNTVIKAFHDTFQFEKKIIESFLANLNR